MDASTRIVALSAAGAGAALVQYCSGCKASNIGAAGSLLAADQVTGAEWRQFDELGYVKLGKLVRQHTPVLYTSSIIYHNG